MDLHFNCTQCGQCCRNIKIPLTASEAVAWLTDGNQVQLISEASPWPEDISGADPKAAHLKRRSFMAMSGCLPTRVVAMLVANITGECPHLLADRRCGIYGRRPLVCRIYPVEINPFMRLEPGKKACPAEAWAPDLPTLLSRGRVVSQEIRDDLRQWRHSDSADVDIKRAVYAALNIVDSAVAQEGFLVYSPDAGVLLRALSAAIEGGRDASSSLQCRFVSDRSDTLDNLSQCGAIASHSRDVAAMPYQYIGLKRQAPVTVG